MQALPSAHTTALPMQVPPPQVSRVVQTLSSEGPVMILDVRGGRAAMRAHHGGCVRGDRGQATVELALVLPLLIVLMLLLMQLGFVARDFVRVAHASREAARAASVDPSDDRVREVVRHLLGEAAVDVERAGGIGEPVTASVQYVSRTEVPIIGALLPDITIDDSTTMAAEQE